MGRHLEAARSELPSRGVPGDGHALGIAPRVGGEIPGRIVEEGPVHELGPGVVRAEIRVEEIIGGELPGGHHEANPVHGDGELVHAARERFRSTSEPKGLAQEQPRDVGPGAEIAAAFPNGIAVGQTPEAHGPAHAVAPRHLHIQVQLAPFQRPVPPYTP